MGKNFGIDFGSNTVKISTREKGIVLSEPSLIACDIYSGNPAFFGLEAQLADGRLPGNFMLVHPLRGGILAQYDLAEKLLAQFMENAQGRGLGGAHAVICTPSELSDVEERAYVDCAIAAGIRRVHLVDEALAAAVGAGVDISLPRGVMSVNIGAEHTNIAVSSLGGIAIAQTIHTGGNALNDSIREYVLNKYRIALDDATAEMIKLRIGTVWQSEEVKLCVRGLSKYERLPRSVTISSREILTAVQAPITEILRGICAVINDIPSELAPDIHADGILLTGGGALLNGIDRLIGKATEISVRIPDDPLDCAANGAASLIKAAKNLRNGEVRLAGEKSAWIV